MELTKVKAVSDDSGHWYVIPDDLAVKFRELLEKAENDDDAVDDFTSLFDKYRTGGCLNNTQLYAYLDK